MPRYMPDFPEFRRLVDEARSRGIDTPLVPVFRELVADGLTPVSAYARIARAFATVRESTTPPLTHARSRSKTSEGAFPSSRSDLYRKETASEIASTCEGKRNA